VGFDVDESLGGKLADDGLEAVPSLELLVASGRSSAVRGMSRGRTLEQALTDAADGAAQGQGATFC
jgi:hypothetical protein